MCADGPGRAVGHGALEPERARGQERRRGLRAGEEDLRDRRGAGSPATVAAVEELRGVLWEVLLDQLEEPTAREVGDLADRLAHVCAVALAVALAVPARGMPDVPMSIHDAAPAPPLAGTGARDRATARASQRQAIVVDELARSRLDERQPSAAARVRAGDIEIRDVRGTDGPAAWVSSIGSQLERYERDRLPFAVLLVEVVGIERPSPGGRAESRKARSKRPSGPSRARMAPVARSRASGRAGTGC